MIIRCHWHWLVSTHRVTPLLPMMSSRYHSLLHCLGGNTNKACCQTDGQHAHQSNIGPAQLHSPCAPILCAGVPGLQVLLIQGVNCKKVHQQSLCPVVAPTVLSQQVCSRLPSTYMHVMKQCIGHYDGAGVLRLMYGHAQQQLYAKSIRAPSAASLWSMVAGDYRR